MRLRDIVVGCFVAAASQPLASCSATDAPEGEAPRDTRDSIQTPECTSDDDCEDGQGCSDNICVTTLGQGEACEPVCDEGFFCSSSQPRCIPEGTCLSAADCDDAQECINNVCAIGGECGEREFDIAGLPPNVMLVVDRSGSMSGDIETVEGSGEFVDKWDTAVEAVNAILDEFGETVNFGYMPFPLCDGGPECPAGTVVEVPMGSPVDEIRTAVANTFLCSRERGGGTTLGASLHALIGNSTLQVEGRDNAVILITDGQDTCRGEPDIEALRLRAQGVPVKTYVVGVGLNEADQLTEVAESGGTESYLAANSGGQLTEGLRSITANVATCTYELEDEAPSTGLWVFFNKDPEPLPRNAKDGWYLDTEANTIEFTGDACEAVKSGEVEAIDVIFACDIPIPK